MIFVSAFDEIVDPARSIIIILQLCLAIGCLVIGIFAIRASKKKEKGLSQYYFLGIAIFFIMMGVSRLILVYHDFYAPDELDFVLWKIAFVLVLVGFVFLSYTIETYVYKKTKHFFTISGLVITIGYTIIWNKTIATLLLYLGQILMILLPFIIYSIMARNATGTIKKKAIIIIIGMAILLVAQGTGLYEMIGIMTRIQATMFGPPASLVGLVICGYGFITMSK